MGVNLENLVPHRTPRFGGLCDWDDPTQIPSGIALACQNMAFLAESVKTRWGLRSTAEAEDPGNPTGMDVLTVLGEVLPPAVEQQQGGGLRARSTLQRPPAGWASSPNAVQPNTQVGIVFTDTGVLFLELPAGSGNLLPVPNTRIADSIKALLPVGAFMQTAKAYNRIYMAFSDLEVALAPVLAFDATTGWISPVGQNPVAAPWQANTFYQQGDIVTSTTNPAVWFRRINTGYSGDTEPTWPTDLGYFTPSYVPHYATATDGGTDPEWQEWTPGFPSYLPRVPDLSFVDHGHGDGSIAGILDVYISLAYTNDLGDSLWIPPFPMYNTTANDAITLMWGTEGRLAGRSLGGPPMSSWLMAVMGLGTDTARDVHWPAPASIKVYVASVAHLAAPPTQFRLYGTFPADGPIVISSIPASGPLFTVPTEPTAAISGQQFKGEGGIRNAILLRQNSMGDLSGADPQGVIPVAFIGAQNLPATISVATSNRNYMYVVVQDITQFAPGMSVQITSQDVPTWTGTYAINLIYAGKDIEWDGTAPSISTSPIGFPAGTLQIHSASLLTAHAAANGGISTKAGPCPVAVVPPGVQEGPLYAEDILAFAVQGVGVAGPFNYIASADPPNPFSSDILFESVDGNGNAYAVVKDSSGFSAGETVAISGWGVPALEGIRVLASVNHSSQTVTFPDTAAAQVQSAPFVGSHIPMKVVQTLPTAVPAGQVGIVLQFDDTTLPEGVDVTQNLLFVALPPAVDLAYLPSVRRMCYVTDRQPTTLIFSEADFMGEIDGLNDVLSIEQSNGARVIGARELLNGMIIACKETGGYQIIPTADTPANWGVNRLWGIHGPKSGRNIATGPEGSTGLDFLMFVDPESGLYKWPPALGEGELDWLSKELSGAANQDATRMSTWDRVNRDAGRMIQVVIDDTAKEVKISVPLISVAPGV